MKKVSKTYYWSLVTGHWSLVKSGQVMVFALVLLAAILILSASQFDRVGSFISFGSRSNLNELAINVAEAGIDKAIYELNDTAGSFSGETDIQVGTTGTYTTTVNELTSSLKEITVTGYVPNSTNPEAKRTVTVEAYISNESISFNYAVQTGPGGLEMYSNSRINGNMYTNGNIQGYSNSRINGDAFAVGTISSPDPWITGTTNPGEPEAPLPEFDEQYWKDQANINSDPYAGNLIYNGGTHTLGPKKIEGNMSLNSNTQLTLVGTIHVTGDFSMNSNSDIFLDEAFGSTGTVIIVDGKISMNSNGEVHTTSATPPGYIILASTKSSGTAIELNSNAKAGALYALNGDLQINSNGDVVALVANKLIMNSNAEINYDSGLASAQYSGGPGGAWQIRKGTYKVIKSP